MHVDVHRVDPRVWSSSSIGGKGPPASPAGVNIEVGPLRPGCRARQGRRQSFPSRHSRRGERPPARPDWLIPRRTGRRDEEGRSGSKRMTITLVTGVWFRSCQHRLARQGPARTGCRLRRHAVAGPPEAAAEARPARAPGLAPPRRRDLGLGRSHDPWRRCCALPPCRIRATGSTNRRPCTNCICPSAPCSRPGAATSGIRLSYLLVAWPWAKVFGTGEVGLRSLSAGLGVGLVPLIYLCGNELVSRRAGLVAAAFAAVNPFMVWYSQEAREYMLPRRAVRRLAALLRPRLARRGSARSRVVDSCSRSSRC